MQRRSCRSAGLRPRTMSKMQHVQRVERAESSEPMSNDLDDHALDALRVELTLSCVLLPSAGCRALAVAEV